MVYSKILAGNGYAAYLALIGDSPSFIAVLALFVPFDLTTVAYFFKAGEPAKHSA